MSFFSGRGGMMSPLYLSFYCRCCSSHSKSLNLLSTVCTVIASYPGSFDYTYRYYTHIWW